MASNFWKSLILRGRGVEATACRAVTLRRLVSAAEELSRDGVRPPKFKACSFYTIQTRTVPSCKILS